MRVHLLGTGSADGWPNAFCTCPSCSSARAEGEIRGQTGALIDERLLIDCGPEIPAAASRHGANLGGVRTMLFTHAHPDHVGPAALLFRHWAHRDEPLDIFAPAAALDQLRHWIAPQDPVQLHPIAAGQRFTTAGYTISALEAAHGDDTIGGAVLFDITDAAGRRLLYGTDTGPLPPDSVDAVGNVQFDLVLLEETFGDHLGHDTDHLDLRSFPEQLRRLRSVNAITDRTDVVAVHLSHHNPPTARLRDRLRPWGARVVPDGTVLAVGGSAPASTSQRPQRTLVLGGARSGKSRHAESMVAAADSVTYVATARPLPDDPEWAARVEAHRARRPPHWTTLETTDVAGVLEDALPGDVVLVDCLTLWLTQVMDDADAWNGEVAGVDKQIARLLEAWVRTRAHVIAVSNEVGQGVVPATASGRLFRDTQGRLNATIAAASESVMMMVAGRALPLEGRTEPRL